VTDKSSAIQGLPQPIHAQRYSHAFTAYSDPRMRAYYLW